MEQISGADAYLNEVLAHVRWKKAHDTIRRELCDHIEDARLGFLARGMADSDAQKSAVMEMGDAAEVGARFDAAYRPAKNYGVWIPFAALFLLGALFRCIVGGSGAVSPGLLLFPVVFAALCFFPFGRLARYGLPLYGLYFTLFAFWAAWTFFSHSEEISSRYLPYLALFFPIVFALLIYRMRGRGIPGLLLLGALFGIQAALNYSLTYYQHIWLLLQCLICLAQLLCAVFSGWFGCKKYAAALVVLVPALLFAIAYTLYNPYSVGRFFDGTGYDAYFQPIVKEILANTPWFGAADTAALSGDSLVFAFGERQDYFAQIYFPVWLSSRLGLFAFTATGLMFLAFFAFALRASLRQRSMLYRFASLGITLYFLIDCALNLTANLGVISAVTFLPFVSGSGVSFLCNAAQAGLLFSMLYSGSLEDDGAEIKRPRWRIKIVREAG